MNSEFARRSPIRCTQCGQYGHALETGCTYTPGDYAQRSKPGIASLADIKGRCRINDETGCWEWSGARSRGASPAKAIPVSWSSKHGRVVSVARLVWEYANRVDLESHIHVWRTCGCDSCVNPKHLLAGTRADMGAWHEQKGTWRGNPARVALNRRLRLARGTVLTMELAAWARESSQSGVEAAHGLMCSTQQVSRARLGKCWAPAVTGASVFSLGMAVNMPTLRRSA